MKFPFKPLAMQKKEEPKKREKNLLPPDRYTDEIPPKAIEVDEKKKLIISVKRDEDLGLPHVDIRWFSMTERYTGYTKKGVAFPLEYLPLVIGYLEAVMRECDEKDLFED